MLLIASGPPLLRSELRDPLASLQGEIDVWILWQLGAYAFAGGLALLYLLKPLRTGIDRRHTVLMTLGVMLCALFATSALWSPSSATTFGMSVLLGVAMLVTAQFAHTGARLEFNSLDLLSALRLLAGILMAMVLVAYLVGARGIIEWTLTGVRIRGGRLGTQQILGPTAFAISLYFLAFRVGRPITQLLWIAFSLVVIWLARTRAAYITTLLSALAIWTIWIRNRPQRIRLMQKLAVTIITGAILLGLVGVSTDLLNTVWYRGGNTDTVTTLNHRTTIWSWTFERLAEQPWGFGYSTGFRHIFLNMDMVTRDAYRHDGLVVERIGEAHNAHMEVLVSAGWPGFVLYAVILGVIAVRGFRALRLAGRDMDLRHGAQLALILLAMYMVDGMATSSYVLPTRQSLGFLLFTSGLALILEARAYQRLRQTQVSWEPVRPIRAEYTTTTTQPERT